MVQIPKGEDCPGLKGRYCDWCDGEHGLWAALALFALSGQVNEPTKEIMEHIMERFVVEGKVERILRDDGTWAYSLLDVEGALRRLRSTKGRIEDDARRGYV